VVHDRRLGAEFSTCDVILALKILDFREIKKINTQSINIPMKKWAQGVGNTQRKRYKWPINT
jgi:hypothetical protein